MSPAAVVPSSDLESEQEIVQELEPAPLRGGRGLLLCRLTAMAASLLGAAALAHHVSTASSSSSGRYSLQSTREAVGGGALEMDEEGGGSFPGFPGMQAMKQELKSHTSVAHSVRGSASS